MSLNDESRPAADTPGGAPLAAERNGRVLILTLSRPDKLNALTPELHRLLHAAVIDAAQDANIGAVVITGAGRAFCSGGDMGGRRDSAGAAPTLEQLAMINGVAAGAGLALALACDLRIAAGGAVLTTSYVNVALSGDLGSSYFLTRLVGSAKARQLMLLSDKIDAAEGHRIGLINLIAEPDTLRETTMQVARHLADGPAVALRYIKRNLLCAETGSLSEVMDSEAFGMARCGRTQDVKEAAQAFRDKRPPIFKGC